MCLDLTWNQEEFGIQSSLQLFSLYLCKFGIAAQVLNFSPRFLSLKITTPKKLLYQSCCKRWAWRSRYELLTWAVCAACWHRRSLADTTVNHITITAWIFLPWGRRLSEAREEEREHAYISKSIMTDCVGSAFLCTDQVSVTDLPKQLHCNKHHTCRSFSRHTESVKRVYSEQWEGWNGEKVKFVWVREALDQLGSQIRRGGSGCLWTGGPSEGLLI